MKNIIERIENREIKTFDALEKTPEPAFVLSFDLEKGTRNVSKICRTDFTRVNVSTFTKQVNNVIAELVTVTVRAKSNSIVKSIDSFREKLDTTANNYKELLAECKECRDIVLSRKESALAILASIGANDGCKACDSARNYAAAIVGGTINDYSREFVAAIKTVAAAVVETAKTPESVAVENGLAPEDIINLKPLRLKIDKAFSAVWRETFDADRTCLEYRANCNRTGAIEVFGLNFSCRKITSAGIVGKTIDKDKLLNLIAREIVLLFIEKIEKAAPIVVDSDTDETEKKTNKKTNK